MPRQRSLQLLCLRCPLLLGCNDAHPACLIRQRQQAQKRASWHRRRTRQTARALLHLAAANRQAMDAAPIRNPLMREEVA